jgi:hypothetical protein
MYGGAGWRTMTVCLLSHQCGQHNSGSKAEAVGERWDWRTAAIHRHTAACAGVPALFCVNSILARVQRLYRTRSYGNNTKLHRSLAVFTRGGLLSGSRSVPVTWMSYSNRLPQKMIHVLLCFHHFPSFHPQLLITFTTNRSTKQPWERTTLI